MLNFIDWTQFDKTKVNTDLLALAKAASVVEYNSADYVTYLRNVFNDDDGFHRAIGVWGEEEIQHGLALAKWAELADPSWNFECALDRFRKAYRVPLDTNASIRGSRSAELVARCIVEVGTTMFYSSLRDASDEPVLKEICRLIAVDEIHHFNLFHRTLPRYLPREPLSKWERAKVAFSRAVEAEDEELLYAYAATNETGEIRRANLTRYLHNYMGRAMPLYTRKTLAKGLSLAVRAIGLEKRKWLPVTLASVLLAVFRGKALFYNWARKAAIISLVPRWLKTQNVNPCIQTPDTLRT